MSVPEVNGLATASPNGGVGAAAKDVAEHASAIARLEAELAGLELKEKVSSLGTGIGLGLTAALLGVFALGFVFLTIAAGLDTFLATWLALLIVTALLAVLTATLALLAKRKIKQATPPLPEQAIEEARLTKEAVTG